MITEETELHDPSGRFTTLHQVAQLLSESLELDVVLQRVMDIVVAVTGAERGFIVLPATDGTLEVRVARNFKHEEIADGSRAISRTLCERVFATGETALIGDALNDDRTSQAQSIVSLQLRSIVCAPLKRQGKTIGVVYLDHQQATGRFGPRHMEVLEAVAQQAAIGIENARLYEEVRSESREIARLKDYQDRVFGSVTAAIVGLDLQGRILSANQAAANLFHVDTVDCIGQSSSRLFGSALSAQLLRAIARASTGLSSEPILIGCQVAGVDRYLRCRVTPLTEDGKVAGFVFLAEDETARILAERAKEREEAEKRRVRDLFGHFVAEPVVEQILAHPELSQLGGSRRLVTVLFADIRGYTTLAETRTPEELVQLLGKYLAVAADTIMEFGGTLDKFMGDGVMAVFNAPLDQPGHALAAAQAGWVMQRRAAREVEGLSFGVGVNTGDVLAGNLGTERFRNYCCVGDATNVAARIQGHAGGGEVLVTESTLQHIRDQVQVEPLGPIDVKGRAAPVSSYRLTGIQGIE